jgi:hypothetical protein
MCIQFTINGKKTVYIMKTYSIVKASDEGMAPRVVAHPGARPTGKESTVDAAESSVFRPSEASEDHYPHACTDGLVFLTYAVFDEPWARKSSAWKWCRAAAARIANSPSP